MKYLIATIVLAATGCSVSPEQQANLNYQASQCQSNGGRVVMQRYRVGCVSPQEDERSERRILACLGSGGTPQIYWTDTYRDCNRKIEIDADVRTTSNQVEMIPMPEFKAYGER